MKRVPGLSLKRGSVQNQKTLRFVKVIREIFSLRYNAVLVSLYFCNNCLPSALLLTSIYDNYNN
ncbi:hypothetical protein GQX74_003368 [Glossina fuscipes]|nr:hypothetical protein GQX74_003368 [Glossina fuscipes]